MPQRRQELFKWSLGIMVRWNTRKIERVNERALRYVYKDRETSYEKLLEQIRLGCTLENRRIQDMLVTINSCFMGKAPRSIVNLISNRKTAYNLRGTNILSLPKVNTTRHGLTSFKYFAAKKRNMLPDNAIFDPSKRTWGDREGHWGRWLWYVIVTKVIF